MFFTTKLNSISKYFFKNELICIKNKSRPKAKNGHFDWLFWIRRRAEEFRLATSWLWPPLWKRHLRPAPSSGNKTLLLCYEILMFMFCLQFGVKTELLKWVLCWTHLVFKRRILALLKIIWNNSPSKELWTPQNTQSLVILILHCCFCQNKPGFWRNGISLWQYWIWPKWVM